MFNSPVVGTEALACHSCSLPWYEYSHGGLFHNFTMLPLCMSWKETKTFVGAQIQAIASTLLLADPNLLKNPQDKLWGELLSLPECPPTSVRQGTHYYQQGENGQKASKHQLSSLPGGAMHSKPLTKRSKRTLCKHNLYLGVNQDSRKADWPHGQGRSP